MERSPADIADNITLNLKAIGELAAVADRGHIETQEALIALYRRMKERLEETQKINDENLREIQNLRREL